MVRKYTSSIPYLIHANFSDPIAVHRCSVEVPVVDDINWYVNWQKYICVKNCPKGSLDENGNVDPLCGGISLRWECESLQFCASFTQTNLTPSCALTRMMRNNAVPFTLLSECCHAMLGHQHADQCIRDSLHRDTKHYTGRFYVNNREQRCEFMSRLEIIWVDVPHPSSTSVGARDCEITSSDPSCQGSPYDITGASCEVSIYCSNVYMTFTSQKPVLTIPFKLLCTTLHRSAAPTAFGGWIKANAWLP